MKAKGILLTTLLAAGVRVHGDYCPKKYLFEPCLCNMMNTIIYVLCKDFYNTVKLQKVIDATHKYRFDRFQIGLSSLPHINATWLAEKGTKRLELTELILKNLFHHISTAPIPSLEILRMEYCVVQYGVRWSQFKQFNWLRQLYVLSTRVEKLGKSFRENVSPHLEYLFLYKTRFTRLEEGDLDGKSNLAGIAISDSGLKILKNSYFKDQKASLISMDFSSNPIESLPDDLFQGFQALRHIILNKSKIKTFSANLIQHVPRSLMDFEIRDTPLVCDCKMKWITGKRSFNVFGRCGLPPPIKSKNLMDLTEKDFTHCGRRNALPFDN